MHTFIHTDGHNLFYRQIKMTNPSLGVDGMIGMALHMILNSMKKEYNRWNGTHVVFYLEGRSWRKDFFEEYKATRKVAFAQLSPREQEDHQLLQEAFDDFVEYLDKKTNITVLQNPKAEADDMIATFIEAHPDDKHILISSDSDFFQLLRFPNVTINDPVKDILIKQDGVYDEDGNRLEFILTSDAKIKAGKQNPDFVCEPKWYEYALFLKCIRGDKTDNIFSAYPGVREKGTRNSVGIREAYEDRGSKGFKWNNFMLQKWVDHNEKEQVVRERYDFNRKLIDLSQIPDDVKAECLRIIAEETERKNVPAVEIGVGFMKFCGKWALKRIGDHSSDFMSMLKAKYAEDAKAATGKAGT
jgi:5'-3' exonuclease